MSAVVWTHWDEAFLAAEAESGKRIVFNLTPPMFAGAMVSLASEHGWLPKSDPRYQEACKDGFLEWWDGRGRCVVIVREGSNAWNQMLAPSHARSPKFAELPDREMPAPKAGDAGPVLDGKPTIITSIGELKLGLTAATYEKAPLVVGPPPPPPGVDLGQPKVDGLGTITSSGDPTRIGMAVAMDPNDQTAQARAAALNARPGKGKKK